MVVVASGLQLIGKEESWQERFERLQERFPDIRGERILQVLRDNGGHAGRSASDLRDMSSVMQKEVDPDESQWVDTLLCSPQLFKQHCVLRFGQFDKNRSGTLEWEETVDLCHDLCHELGIEALSAPTLRAFFDKQDANHDGVLSESEFANFFESFLRHNFCKDKHDGTRVRSHLEISDVGLNTIIDNSVGHIPARKEAPLRPGTPSRVGTPTSRVEAPARTHSKSSLHGPTPCRSPSGTAIPSPSGRRKIDVCDLECRREAQFGRSNRGRGQSGCQASLDGGNMIGASHR